MIIKLSGLISLFYYFIYQNFIYLLVFIHHFQEFSVDFQYLGIDGLCSPSRTIPLKFGFNITTQCLWPISSMKVNWIVIFDLFIIFISVALVVRTATFHLFHANISKPYSTKLQKKHLWGNAFYRYQEAGCLYKNTAPCVLARVHKRE